MCRKGTIRLEDEERGVQPPELLNRQRERKEETEREIRCNESTLHSVLHLPPKHQCDCHSNCNNRRSSSCSNRSNALAMTDTLATVVEETTASGVERDCY